MPCTKKFPARPVSLMRATVLRAALALAAVLAVSSAAPLLQAQTFTVVHSFNGKDGGWPLNSLIQASDGNLYGTTNQGGGAGNGGGTVFKITPSGALTTLYVFCSKPGCADGQEPSGVIEGRDGNFYGTTYNGGINNYGTVFKMSPSGALTTLHTFSFESGGYFPLGGLIEGTDGNFYGTTTVGGATAQEDWGVVYKITSAGEFTLLYSFLFSDGEVPSSSLLQASDGNLYGTTWGGGLNGGGVIFKITTSGTFSTLYSFCAQTNCADGDGPNGGALIQATDGNLYGVTNSGGINSPKCTYGCGTVFKITLGGALTTLYSFCSQPGCTDGAKPYAALVQGSDGKLYGTTVNGGPANDGATFQITMDGAFAPIYDFCLQAGCPDGQLLYPGLTQHTNGRLYGAAYHGGAYSRNGTLYKLSVGLKPFVKTQPTSGKVGTTVRILGTSLTGATSVRFNGTPATFTVVAGSLITATVPAGATSGEVQVVTSSGKILSSNVTFQVNP
jgi:uncharacterized repeat protein (TIGR03803 family)